MIGSTVISVRHKQFILYYISVFILFHSFVRSRDSRYSKWFGNRFVRLRRPCDQTSPAPYNEDNSDSDPGSSSASEIEENESRPDSELSLSSSIMRGRTRALDWYLTNWWSQKTVCPQILSLAATSKNWNRSTKNGRLKYCHFLLKVSAITRQSTWLTTSKNKTDARNRDAKWSPLHIA